MCTELGTQAPLFFIHDQLYLSTAPDTHHHLLFGSRSNGLEFSSPRQFRKYKLYDYNEDSECDLLLELNSSLSSPILGEVGVVSLALQLHQCAWYIIILCSFMKGCNLSLIKQTPLLFGFFYLGMYNIIITVVLHV